jgi:hypothetical protein
MKLGLCRVGDESTGAACFPIDLSDRCVCLLEELLFLLPRLLCPAWRVLALALAVPLAAAAAGWAGPLAAAAFFFIFALLFVFWSVVFPLPEALDCSLWCIRPGCWRGWIRTCVLLACQCSCCCCAVGRLCIHGSSSIHCIQGRPSIFTVEFSSFAADCVCLVCSLGWCTLTKCFDESNVGFEGTFESICENFVGVDQLVVAVA